MWNAIIQTLTIQIGGDSQTVEVVAEVMEGNGSRIKLRRAKSKTLVQVLAQGFLLKLLE